MTALILCGLARERVTGGGLPKKRRPASPLYTDIGTAAASGSVRAWLTHATNRSLSPEYDCPDAAVKIH